MLRAMVGVLCGLGVVLLPQHNLQTTALNENYVDTNVPLPGRHAPQGRIMVADSSNGGETARPPAGKGEPLDEKRANIIFVGNSYTSCNDLPGAIVHLLSTRGFRARAGRYLLGGKTLMEHWRHNLGQAGEREKARNPHADFTGWKGRFDELLRDGTWDYVVLQGNSRDTLRNWGFSEAARLWAEKIRTESPNTRAVFYMTWARRARPQDQATITKGYRDAADRDGALVAPVGEAWKMALAARPGLVLHAEDGFHPTLLGTYLAACVFYASLTGESPVGLPGKFETPGDEGAKYDLPEDDALFLQQIAWQAHREGQKANGPDRSRSADTE